jgi:protoporphyrinogen oxidase
MARIGIVGGGMLGMTLAWRFALQGHRPVVFESSDRCGGLAAPWQLGEVTWDRHYHVILSSDRALRSLLDELGLAQDLRWATTRTGFYVRGKMYSLSGVGDFLRFPPLSPLEKIRLATTILTAARISNGVPLESLTAIDWLTRYSGRNTVEKLWLPLLRAKLGSYAEQASAAFIWTIIRRMYGARRSGAKREQLGYVRGGYESILRRFEERLRTAGVDIRCNCRIQAVDSNGAQPVVVTATGSQERCDAVVVTLASPLAERICPTLTAQERARCAGVHYQGIVCASFLSDTPVSPFYITNITDQWVPFTAVIEMSALVDPTAFGGESLIYLPRYAPAGSPVFGVSDEGLRDEFLSALERMHPHFSRRSVRAFRVSRVPFVMPVPTLDYSKRLPPLRTATRGLYLADSAHIVNGTLNVNETVGLANEAARTVMADLRAEAPVEAAV